MSDGGYFSEKTRDIILVFGTLLAVVQTYFVFRPLRSKDGGNPSVFRPPQVRFPTHLRDFREWVSTLALYPQALAFCATLLVGLAVFGGIADLLQERVAVVWMVFWFAAFLCGLGVGVISPIILALSLNSWDEDYDERLARQVVRVWPVLTVLSLWLVLASEANESQNLVSPMYISACIFLGFSFLAFIGVIVEWFSHRRA
jgi:hypothetical protein